MNYLGILVQPWSFIDGTQAEAEPAAIVPAEVLPPKETTEELLKQIVKLIKRPKA